MYDTEEETEDGDIVTKWDILWENNTFTRCEDTDLALQIELETDNSWNAELNYRVRIHYHGEQQYYL